MMESINNVFKKFPSLLGAFKKREVVYIKKGIRPGYYWILLLSIFAVLFCIVGGISYYLYHGIETHQFFTVEQDSVEHSIGINTALLKQVIYDLDQKQTEAGALKTNSPSASDPSI